MLISEWQVRFTFRRRQWPVVVRPLLAELGRVDGWLDEHGVADGTPFLIGPGGGYDVTLNEYFVAMRMAVASPHTREAAARDLARFFNFLWLHRPPLSDGMGGERRRSWRDATEADRRAFEWWRCRDESGPQVRASTWDREVASANGFYRWAVSRGHVSSSPVVQRPSRDGRRGVARRSAEAEVPAEYRPDERRDQVVWLTPSAYRLWRDVGVRGYGADGLPDQRFRGRNISRNAAFCDLMVRCGLRLQEQASLTVYEVPDRAASARFHRSWLPAAIAKYGSARAFYVPDGVLRDVRAYLDIDRRTAVESAQAAGRYERIADPLVIEDPGSGAVRRGRRLVKVERLDPAQRLRLLIRTETGLEPAVLWLGEDGMPLGVRAWKSVFRTASDRCKHLGISTYCHAHMLRHSFAVALLEHLQRGHLEALGALGIEQRRHYQMVFGDPLDWVRRALGHRSVETTQKYLHTLAELEMATRLALFGDAFDNDPRLAGVGAAAVTS